MGLINAVHDGDYAAVSRLLANGQSVDTQDRYGNTILMLAAGKGHLQIVNLLLSRRANINATGSLLMTALMWAARAGQFEVVQVLVAAHANINARDVNGKMAFMWALEYGHIQVARLLIPEGMGIDTPMKDGETALGLAAEKEQWKTVQFLLQEGANFNIRVNGLTLFLWAARQGAVEVVNWLLNQPSIDVNMSTQQGQTALMLAAQAGQTKVLGPLLEAGAAINHKDSGGQTALVLAAQNLRLETVQLLLNRGADFDVCIQQEPILIWAIQHGYETIVSQLLALGADANTKDAAGNPALVVAAQAGYKRMVSDLLTHRADFNVRIQQEPLLIWAVKNHAPDIITQLLDLGAAVNIPDENGQTALVLAAQSLQLETVQLLLSRGANANVFIEEVPLLIWAVRNAAPDIITQLLDLGANVNVTDNNGRTALVLAAQSLQLETVKLLLSRRADFEVNVRGIPFLDWVVEHGYQDIVRQLLDLNLQAAYKTRLLLRAAQWEKTGIIALLLDHPVSVNVSNEFGQTPLTVAAENNRREAVKLLLERGADFEVYVGQLPFLDWVVERGYQDVVQLLLNLHLQDRYKVNLLVSAAACGRTDILNLLLDNQVPVDVSDERGRTPLTVAAEHNQCQTVRLLLSSGANFDSRIGPEPILIWAVQHGYEPIVRQLLELGTDADTQDSAGNPALVVAAQAGYGNLVSSLLAYGAECRGVYIGGESLLIWAIRHGCENVVNQLLELGVDANTKDSAGNPGLILAAQAGHGNLVSALLAHGAECRGVCIGGEPLLIWAILYGCESVVNQLLQRGEDADTKDSAGNPALVVAAQARHENLVSALLAHGAAINVRVHRDPILIWAVRRNSETVVNQLVERGADVDIEDESGKTALMWTKDMKYTALPAVLVRRRRAVDAQDENGRTELMQASEGGNALKVNRLVAQGAKIDIKDMDGNTAFLLAIANKHKDIALFLFKQGAAINVINSNQRTPVRLAYENEWRDLVDILLVKANSKFDLKWAIQIDDLSIQQRLIKNGADEQWARQKVRQEEMENQARVIKPPHIIPPQNILDEFYPD